MTVNHNLSEIMTDEVVTPEEGTNSEEELDLNLELEGQADEENLADKLAELEEAKRQLTARAKKAEEELKSLKTKPVPPVRNENINNPLTDEAIDVKILKSQGVDDEAIAKLKKLAKLNDTSLIEAQNDDIFISWKEKREAEEKAEKAKLGASRGSGSVKKTKDLNSPDVSDAEHKELWKASQGR